MSEKFDLYYTDIYDEYSNNTTMFIYYHAYRHTVENQNLIYKLIAFINFLLNDWSIIPLEIQYKYLFYKNIRYTGNYSHIITKLQNDISEKFKDININFNYTPSETFIPTFEPHITNTIQSFNLTYKFLFDNDYIYFGKLDNLKAQLKSKKISSDIDYIFDYNGIICYLKTKKNVNSSKNIIIVESNSHINNIIIKTLNIQREDDAHRNLNTIDKINKTNEILLDQNLITIEPYDNSIKINLNFEFWHDKLYLGFNNFQQIDENNYILIYNDLNLTKFNNLLKAFNALNNKYFIFNKFKITPSELPNFYKTDSVNFDLSIEHSESKMYELIGYNQLKLIVNYNYSSDDWLDLISLGFIYHFNDCSWTKYPYNYIDIDILTASLGMIENKREVENNKIVKYNFNKPIVNLYDKKYKVLEFLNEIVTKNLEISIYINSLSSLDNKFKGSQLNYSDNISSIWISFKRPDFENYYISLNINWNWVKSTDEEMRHVLENILLNNTKYCYNIKAIQLQLKINKINFNPDTFEGDVLLAYWIYNPRFYDYYDQMNDINITGDISLPYIYDMYPCGYKYRYELKNIINNFIKNADTYIDDETLYSVYPLILCKLMLPKLQELSLYEQYLIELKANIIFANMEYHGITVNQPKLLQLEHCMTNFLKKNIPDVLSYFKHIIPRLGDNWLLLENNIINYHNEIFIPIFKEFAKENGYAEPYLEINDKLPKSWKYIRGFIVRNSNIPNELKSKLKLLQLILQMKFIYEIKINELKQNIKADGKIHPCINSIGYNFGRLLTNSPNIHFAPNTETTQWGKYYRRCIQSKPGYKLIKADWKSQELYTLALLLNDHEFTKTLAGDFHINTGKILFSGQNILIINIKKIDTDDYLIDCTCNNEEILKGISIYYNDFFYTISQIKKIGENLYQFKLSNEILSNFKIKIDNQLTYITNQQRQISKRLNFGLMYSEPISRLQENLQIDEATLQKYIDAWWLIYPKITEFIKNIRRQTNIDGFYKTFKGRRMFFPELLQNSDISILNAEKRDLLLTFVNSGTAVDLLKQSIIMITEGIEVAECDAYIVHTLHDEIIIEVADKDVDLVKILVRDAMTEYAFPEFFKRGINISADIDVCLWWDKCKESENSHDFIIEDDDCPAFE